MAVTFPNSPTVNESYTAENGLIYIWDGEKWKSQGSYDADAGNYISAVNDDTAAGALTFQGLTTHEGGVNVTGGNVGIGTTSPATSLVVYDPTARNSDYFNSPVQIGNAGTGANGGHMTDEGPSLVFRLKRSSDGSQSSSAYIKAVAEGDLTSSWPTSLAFSLKRFGDSPAELMRLTSEGNLGIGTTDPQQKLDINGKYARVGDGTSTGIIQYGSNTQSNTNFHLGAASGVFRLWNGDIDAGTEILRINNTGGVSWDNGGSFLDDYEEGTWTPTMTGALTYTQREGQYTKIGRLVTFQCRIQVDTFTSSAAGVEVSGLPFTTGSDTNLTGFGGAYFTFGNLFTDETNASFRWHAPLNNTTLQLRGGTTSTSGVAVNNVGVVYTRSFMLSGSYYTN